MNKTKKDTNLSKQRNKKLLIGLAGCVTGLANGVFGGGGGMIVVPFLVHILKKEPKVAHATAILIILPLSIVSAILYASFGNYDYGIGLPVLAGVVGGGVIGSFALKKISAPAVMIIFAVVMLVAGGKMLLF